jgi:hypothetical protein
MPVINQTLSSFRFLTASADTYCGTSAEVHYISIEARFGDQGGETWNRRDFAATVIQIDFSVNLGRSECLMARDIPGHVTAGFHGALRANHLRLVASVVLTRCIYT